jgi:hypothetical protein
MSKEIVGFWKWIAGGIKSIPRKIKKATWNPAKWNRSSKEMFVALAISCSPLILVYADPNFNPLTLISIILLFVVAFMCLLHGIYADAELTKET